MAAGMCVYLMIRRKKTAIFTDAKETTSIRVFASIRGPSYLGVIVKIGVFHSKKENYNQFVHKLISFKLNLIPYPSIPNSSSLENFSMVKFIFGNRNFSKIAPFATLAICQYHVCNLSTIDRNFL
jgi:hypothetical protein